MKNHIRQLSCTSCEVQFSELCSQAAEATPTTPSGGGGGALTKISEQELSSAAANVTFSSIPQTYRNLILRYACRGDSAAGGVKMYLQFNGDTGANYNRARTFGGSTSGTETSFGITYGWVGIPSAASAPVNRAGVGTLTIYDYARTFFCKNLTNVEMANQGATTLYLEIDVMEWLSTAAITSIKLFPENGNFVTGSLFSLYGES